MKSLLKHRGLLIILGLALIVRVIYLLLYSQLPDWTILTVDNYYHHNLATVIANGNFWGDTTYFRAPFYIYMLALIYKLFGVSLWAGRIFGFLIGLGTIITTYKMADLIFNRRVALFAALLTAFYPALLYFEGELLLDSFFTLLLELSILFFISYYKKNKIKTLIISAVFLGLAAITRPTGLVVLPAFILILFFQPDQLTLKFKRALLYLIPLVLIIAPLTIRNIIIADDPVLIASQGGINFYIGNNDSADGISAVLPEPMGFNWRISQITYLAESALQKKLKPGEVSSYWYDRGVDWIIKNPGKFISLYLKKVYLNFSDREISNNRNLDTFYMKIPLLRYNPLSFGILFLFSCFGLVFFFADKRETRILAAIILIYILISSLFFYNSRFRLPLLPLYITITAGTVVMMVENYKNLKKRLALVVPLLLLIGLFSFYPLVNFRQGQPVLEYTTAGNFYFAQKDYPVAGQFYKIAAEKGATYSEVNLNLGNYYMMTGVEDSARYYFNRELDLFPRHYKALTNLASLAFLNNDYGLSGKYIDRALQIAPYDLTANLLNYRLVFAESGISADKRLRIINDGLEACDYNRELLIEAALLFGEKHEFKYVDIILDKLDQNPPPPVETDDELFSNIFISKYFNRSRQLGRMYYQLGFIEGTNGKIDRSINHNQLAIGYDSSLVEAYINLVNGYLAQQSYGPANEIYQIASRRFPNHPYLEKIKPLLK